MGELIIRDKSGKVIATVKGAKSEAEARQKYEEQKAQRAEQAQFPAPQEASPLDTLISAIPLPGMSFLTGTARDVARGVGPTEKGKEILKDKSFMEALDLYGRGLGANIYSNATVGIGPAVNAAMGDTSVDEDLALSRELYGDTGNIAVGLPFGIGATKAAGPLLSPVTKVTGADKFAPGGWQALKRILAGGADDAVSTATSSTIRGEDYGPADVADSFWQSLKTGTALELLLGGKRKAGKTYAERGMTPQQKKMDDAILAMERMRKTQGPRQDWHETVRDELGTPGTKTLNKLRGLDEEGFQRRQLEAEERQQMTPVRTQQEMSALAGEQLQGDSKGRAQAQEATDRAYGYSSQYLPQFESQPRMPNVSVQRDWGEISQKTGKPIKTRITIPRGYEDTIETRGDYNDYLAARGRAQTYADRVAMRDNRGRDPTDTEVFWYTVRDLEGQGGNAKVLGEIFRDRFRTQFPDLDNIISAQHIEHAGARAAKHGGELLDKPWMAGTPEGREARSTPANRREMEKGFLNQVIGKAAGTDKGTTLPRSSPNTRKIAAEALGPQRAGILDQFLRREEGKFNVDDPIIKNKGQALPGSELTVPTGMMRRGLGAGARLLAGAITGGPTGLLWAAPGAAARFRINPNEMMDVNIGKNMVDIFGMKDIPQPRAKNKVERSGNVGGLVPLIRGVAEQERQERRERKRKSKANSKDLLE